MLLILLVTSVVVFGEANGSGDLTMVTQNFHRAGSSSTILLACYGSTPDSDAALRLGRLPVHLPGAGIDSSTTFPEGTAAYGFDGVEMRQLPVNNDNATGIYYCERSQGEQTSRAYSSVHHTNPWYWPGASTDLQLTKTINGGENATLSVVGRSTTYALWRRIRDGVGTNLTEYGGMETITIPANQTRHGDLYAVVNPLVSPSRNRFTLMRLIVRGCAAGKWGAPDCDGICDLCYNGGVCDDKTGDCICPPGFSGPNCLTVCQDGQFGRHCEHRCGTDQLLSCIYIQFGLPDPFGISCMPGRWGYGCNYACYFERFGAGCSQKCHCRVPSSCNSRSGECMAGGCAEGWSDTYCQVPDVCPAGYYGLNCVSKCRCRDDASCDKDTGYCSGGCAPGLTCVSRKCEDGYFGEDCRAECRCMDTRCDGMTGSCQSGRCLKQYQTDGTGICQFVLPVLSQPPEASVKSTSAIVSWMAWGTHPSDAGDGPIVGYRIYRSNHSVPTTASWIQAGHVSASYQPPGDFVWEIESLQQLTVYNFSVSAVREGRGGEGPRSPVKTIRTEAAENSPEPATEVNVGVIVAVCVFVLAIVIVVVVDYLRFRKLSRRWESTQQSGEGALQMGSVAAYANTISNGEPSNARASVHMEGIEEADGASAVAVYEDVAQPWTDDLLVAIDRLSIGYHVVGTGHFGPVRVATLILADGQSKTAVKQLKRGASPGDRARFVEEYRLLADIGAHPHVINFLAICFEEADVYVALEHLPNGDLRSYLRNARSSAEDGRSPLSAAMLLQFAVGVAEGMQHVAASGVIHRKLAARNILLDDNLVAKVAGFGEARCAGAIVEKPKVFLPPRWMSMESLKTNTYTSKSDVWSFGILLWEIASLGATPYSGIKASGLMSRLENGYRMAKPINCDGEIYELMLQCWQEDPNDRPPFKTLASILGTMAHSHKKQGYIKMPPESDAHPYLNIRPDQDNN